MNPEHIGPYKVIRELGRGALARVFLVENADGKKFALKVLYESLATESGIEMLRREARISKRLIHPNIVATINYVMLPPDNHCLLMEYVDGEDLGKTILRKGKLPINQIIQIAWEICRGLEYAHPRDVIHRDIKPQNILYTSSKHIKITDFNLSSAATESIATLTAGRLIGTPYYLSPEQANFEKGDERSDIYSVGIILYEMLTGKKPFVHEQIPVILEMHKHAQPENIMALRPDTPLLLARLVEMAMEKSPSRRFQSAMEMREKIEEIAKTEGVELIEPVKLPSAWDRFNNIFLRWDEKRLRELITNLLAAILYVLVPAVVIWFLVNISKNASGNNITPTHTQAALTLTSEIVMELTNTPARSETHITISPTKTETLAPTRTPALTTTITPASTLQPTSSPTSENESSNIAPFLVTPTQKAQITLRVNNQLKNQWACVSITAQGTGYSIPWKCIYSGKSDKFYTNNVLHLIRITVYEPRSTSKVLTSYPINTLLSTDTSISIIGDGSRYEITP